MDELFGGVANQVVPATRVSCQRNHREFYAKFTSYEWANSTDITRAWDCVLNDRHRLSRRLRIGYQLTTLWGFQGVAVGLFTASSRSPCTEIFDLTVAAAML
jgi:hypothetical protein